MFYHFPILDLALKKSRSAQGHHLNNLDSTQVPDAIYQVSRPSITWFLRRRFVKVLPYMGMAAMLVMWPRLFEQIFVPSAPWNLLHMKFGYNWPSGFWGNVWNCQNRPERPGSKVKQWPWPLVCINFHVFIKVTVYTNFQVKIFNSFQEILCSGIFPYKG